MRLHSEDEYSVTEGSCSSSSTARTPDSTDDLEEGWFSGDTLPPGGYDELVQGQEAYLHHHNHQDSVDNDNGDVVSSADAGDNNNNNNNRRERPVPEVQLRSNNKNRKRTTTSSSNNNNDNNNNAGLPLGAAGLVRGAAGNSATTTSRGDEPEEMVEHVPVDLKPDADEEEEELLLLPDAELVGDDTATDREGGITKQNGYEDLEGNHEERKDHDDDDDDGGVDGARQHDEQTPEELKEELEEERRRRRRRRFIWLLLCLLCCLLILLISLILYWVNREDEEIFPTMAPTEDVSRNSVILGALFTHRDILMHATDLLSVLIPLYTLSIHTHLTRSLSQTQSSEPGSKNSPHSRVPRGPCLGPPSDWTPIT